MSPIPCGACAAGDGGHNTNTVCCIVRGYLTGEWLRKVNSININFLFFQTYHEAFSLCTPSFFGVHKIALLSRYHPGQNLRPWELVVLTPSFFVVQKKGTPPKFDESSIPHESVKSVPMQVNSFDCGLFLLTYVEFFAFVAPFEMHQDHSGML